MVKQNRGSSFNKETKIDLTILGLLWLSAIVLVNPMGNFPLNDDWSYYITVQRLLETGSFLPVWSSSTLITQTYWGALFCKIFGFSFEVLRYTTLGTSMAGVFTVYFIGKQLKLSRKLSVIWALCVAFNPLYFTLSFTFMTDVYFTFFSALSLFFFIRYLQNEKNSDLGIGVMVSLIAIMCRQLGLYIPMAFAFTFLIKKYIEKTLLVNPLSILLRAAFPLILGLVLLYGFNHWLEVTSRIPAAYDLQGSKVKELFQNLAVLPYRIIRYGFFVLIYMGWFLLPIVLWVFFSKKMTRFRIALFGIVVLFTGCIFYSLKSIMPMVGNILHESGIGPLLLYDVRYAGMSNFVPLPFPFWHIVTALGVLGGIILVSLAGLGISQLLVKAYRKVSDNTDVVYLLFITSTGVYLAPLLIFGFFDRYLIPLLVILPPILFYFHRELQVKRSQVNVLTALVGGLVLCQMVFSIASTHDYMALNRAKWETLTHTLEVENIPQSEIDAGIEFNGLHLYESGAMIKSFNTTLFRKQRKYVITFGQMPGYESVSQYEYKKWLPPRNAHIHVLKMLPR